MLSKMGCAAAPFTGVKPAGGSRHDTHVPFQFFAADKTDPGACNLPVYLAFADPMPTSGLMLAPGMSKGFRFVIMDLSQIEGDRIIELDAPEYLYAIATLLRDSVSPRAIGARRQGFFGAAWLPMSELEYTRLMEKLAELDSRFQLRRAD